MLYQWDMQGANSFGNDSVTNIRAAEPPVPLNNAMLVVDNATLLVADSVISITLTVQNFMGGQARATFAVSVAGNPLPSIRIESDVNVQVRGPVQGFFPVACKPIRLHTQSMFLSCRVS